MKIELLANTAPRVFLVYLDFTDYEKYVTRCKGPSWAEPRYEITQKTRDNILAQVSLRRIHSWIHVDWPPFGKPSLQYRTYVISDRE